MFIRGICRNSWSLLNFARQEGSGVQPIIQTLRICWVFANGSFGHPSWTVIFRWFSSLWGRHLMMFTIVLRVRQFKRIRWVRQYSCPIEKFYRTNERNYSISKNFKKKYFLFIWTFASPITTAKVYFEFARNGFKLTMSSGRASKTFARILSTLLSNSTNG